MIDKLKDHWNDFIAHPWIPLTKVLGYFMVWPAIPLRAWARNYVYSHVLSNNLPLKRLYERNPQRMTGGWVLQDVHNVEDTNGFSVIGTVKERKTNKLTYYLVVLFIWGWLDDDSNQDTTDIGYIKELYDGKRKSHILGHLFRKQFGELLKLQLVYGNAFDLGDTRSNFPVFSAPATYAWTARNTAMNFKYLWANY